MHTSNLGNSSTIGWKLRSRKLYVHNSLSQISRASYSDFQWSMFNLSIILPLMSPFVYISVVSTFNSK